MVTSFPISRVLAACALSCAVVLAGCGADSSSESALLADVQQRLARGDTVGAQIQLKTLLAAHPQSAVARLALGKLLLAAGDAAGAEVELRRALQGGQSRQDVLPSLAVALMDQRKVAEVVPLAEGEPLADPQAAADLAVSVAQALQRSGEAPRARQVVEGALTRAPGHPGLAAMGARLAAEQGRREEAAATARALVEKHPLRADAWLLHADVLADNGSPEAAGAYQKVLSLDPRSVDAHGALIQAALERGDLEQAGVHLERMSKALPGRGPTLYFQVQLAFSRGELDQARTGAQLLLRGEPDSPLAQMLAGMIERRMGSLELAQTLLAKALKSMPGNRQLRQELASALLSQGLGAQALAVLQPNLRPQADDAQSWALAAQAHTLGSDYKAAEAALARARAAGSTGPGTKLAQGRALLQRGELALATRELQAASDQEPGGRATLELVGALMQQRQWARALEATNQLIGQQARAPLPHVLRGRILEAQGDTAGARQAYGDALQRFEAFLPALERLAELDLAQGAPDAARQRYARLAQRNPMPVPVALALASLEGRLGAPAQARLWLDKAVAADPRDGGVWLAAIAVEQRLGDPEGAVVRAEKAALALPEHAGIQMAWSQALKVAGRPSQALGPLRRAAALEPQSSAIRLALVQALVASYDLAEARREVDRARGLEPESAPLEKADIVLLIRERETAKALALLERRRSRMPGDGETARLLAEVHSAAGNHAAAIAALRAVPVRNRSSTVAVALSHALRKGGEKLAAEQFEREWLQAHPRDAEFLGHLAQQAEQRGDKTQAIARYRQVLALVPDAALVMNNLAYLLIETQAQEALALAERAVSLAPGSAPLLDTLAQARWASGDRARAIEARTEAVRLDPRAISLRLGLARMHLESGDKERAREQLRHVIAIPGDRASEQALADLRRLAGS